MTVDVPLPPDLETIATGPHPPQGFVVNVTFAEECQSSVLLTSEPFTLKDKISSLDLPRFAPRIVTRVPPEAGPNLGVTTVISGGPHPDIICPSVGVRRGLKFNVNLFLVSFKDEGGGGGGLSIGGGGSGREISPLSVLVKFSLDAIEVNVFMFGFVYKFSWECDPFSDIDAISMDCRRFDRSLAKLDGKKLLLKAAVHVLVAFLKATTQQSRQRSPLDGAFFMASGIHLRRCAAEGTCARGTDTLPMTSSLSYTVNTRGPALTTLLQGEYKVI